MIDLMIITGASRGIGAEIANTCLAKNLVLLSSSDLIFKAGHRNRGKKVFLQIDLGDLENLTARLQEEFKLLENIKTIGVALCGAQIGDHGGLYGSNLHCWERLYRTNVLGNLAVLQALEPYLQNKNRLRAVFFAGGGAAYAYSEFSGYALTKVAVVRAVENLGEEFKVRGFDASIVALAPGAVDTEMLARVLAHGGTVKTRTSIREPADFVQKFISDQFDSVALNGRFLHVRDDLKSIDFTSNKIDLFKLRRVE